MVEMEQAARRRRARGVVPSRRSWVLDFLCLGALGLLWALATPLMAVPDEPAHAIKAAAVVRGDLTTDYELVDNGLTQIPVTRLRVPAGYADLRAREACLAPRGEAVSTCLESTPIGGSTPIVDGSTYVGAYQPTYYLIVGWPSRFLEPELALRAMRGISALVVAAFLAAGLRSARSLSTTGAVPVIASLAITPMALFLGGAINPNGLEVASAFAFWAALLHLVRDEAPPARSHLVTLAASGVALATTRPSSPFILLGIVGVVWCFAGSRSALARLVRDRRIVIALAIVAVVTAASVAFVLLNHSTSGLITHPVDQRSLLGQLRTGFETTGQWLEEAVGVLGWIGFVKPELPSEIVVGWLASLAVLAVLALRIASRRQQLVIVALIAGVVAIPPLSEAATQGQYPWQGRYILPVAAGLPLLVGVILDRAPRRGEVPHVLLQLVAVGMAAGQAIAFVSTAGYNLAGDTGLVPVLSGTWPGPFRPGVWYVVAALASAGWGWRLLGMLAPPDAPEPAPPHR